MPPRRTRTDTKAASRKSPPAPARRQTTSAKFVSLCSIALFISQLTHRAPRRTSNKATVADEPMEVAAKYVYFTSLVAYRLIAL